MTSESGWVRPAWERVTPPGEEQSWERQKRITEEYIAEHGLTHYSEWDYEDDD